MFENIYKKVEENKEIKFIPYDMYNELTICGRSIEEVITILEALDFERETGIKVTMENLSRIIKLYQAEQQKQLEQAITDAFHSEKHTTSTLAKDEKTI